MDSREHIFLDRVNESESLCLLQQHQAADDNNASKSSAPTGEKSFTQPPSFPSRSDVALLQTPPAPHGVLPSCSQPTRSSFPLPIPPFPPVSPHLLNGTIPAPPPGWIPPPGHCLPLLPLPPPSHPTPPTFVRPPPPVRVPPCFPPPLPRFLFTILPPAPLDTTTQSNGGTAPPFPLPPWPLPPKWNPFFPPPNFPVVRENQHKVMIEKVLQVILDELKVIIKKDITRRMVEGIAFKSFEDWWDSQNMKTKVIL